jgi:hypothetical protein
MPTGTHPHVLVVGDGNPIAMPGMARLGARWGKIRQIRCARSACVGKPRYGGLLKTLLAYYQPQDLPLGLSDIFFQNHVLLRYRSIWGGGACFSRACGGEEGTAGSAVGCGYWSSRRQPVSSATVGRLLAADLPCDRQVSIRDEA